MPYRIIYIDDNKEARETFAKALSSQGLVEIDPIPPSSFEDTISHLKSNQDNFDAIILDLRLDDMEAGKQYATYTATSLTQGLRSELTDVKSVFKKEFPIFLLTSQTKLGASYDFDLTSHNLFDGLFFKQELGEQSKHFEFVISEMIESYYVIGGNRDANSLLKIDVKNISEDVLPAKFIYSPKDMSIYQISQLINSYLINNSGVLIDENILAARLGVDISSSSDWPVLKEYLGDLKYKGIYSTVWDRWWSFELLNWWRREFKGNKPLLNLKAGERVSLLKEKYGVKNIIPAEPTKYAKGDKFWTICQALDVPLDITDGFLVDDFDSKTWHDKKYISLHSIVERIYKHKNISIHPSEHERVRMAKELL